MQNMIYFQKKHREQKTGYIVRRIAVMAVLCLMTKFAAPLLEGSSLPGDGDMAAELGSFLIRTQLLYDLELPKPGPDIIIKAASPIFWGDGLTYEKAPPFDEDEAELLDAPELSDNAAPDGIAPRDEPYDNAPYDNADERISDGEASGREDAGASEGSDRQNPVLTAEGMEIKNNTGYEIDAAALLNEAVSIPKGSRVLIIHTHGSESYTPAEDDTYTESEPFRTKDTGYNVVHLGDILTDILTERGIDVIHERELYDYPSYAGAYNRSHDSIAAHMEEHGDIAAVIDLHRDAIIGTDGTVYKTMAEIDGEKCAQVMIISGSDWSGLNHPDWRKNLVFAVHLQAAMMAKYPTLARPLNISKYRYNQQMTKGSLIIEVGCSGNTLKEAERAVSYFGDCLGDVLSSLE